MGIYRYICPNCLRTFLDEKGEKDRLCYNCGDILIVIPDPPCSLKKETENEDSR